ncbi:hypothetical protein E4L95_14275 [Paracoccus liaowanqingii]|uniref:Uncharacterized protein n=1 Tax=Paracoccus liaowanqingii TaxID=2560053 RepID=A0A4Z1BJ67_9RHOB|nr:hypothetical protein [Paracoccus liaowanqingii]TGN56385.1 hypothetical protein E4L95_14275 [Paracoccus liaowanqingii]
MDHPLKYHGVVAVLASLVGLSLYGVPGAALGLLVGPFVLAVVMGVMGFALSVKTSVERSATGPMGRHRSSPAVQGVAARDVRRGSDKY